MVLSLSLSACVRKPADSEVTDAAPQNERSSNHIARQQIEKRPAEHNDSVHKDTPAYKVQILDPNNQAGESWNHGAQSTDTTSSWHDTSTDAAAATNDEDPWEGFNRVIVLFNNTVDMYFLMPVATGYKKFTPEFMQKGVSHFFSNIGEISNLTNNALQGKKNGFIASTWRFVINTTVGVFGLFDVASALGVRQYDEDFGQTLGYWGVSSGPYLVLPFFGPSTVRDASGMAVDYMNYDPINALDPNRDQKIGRWFLYAVEKRARYLSAESLIVGDRYSFIRDAYLQSRVNEIYDGKPPQPKQQAKLSSEDSWRDESSADSWGDNESGETHNSDDDSATKQTIPDSDSKSKPLSGDNISSNQEQRSLQEIAGPDSTQL